MHNHIIPTWVKNRYSIQYDIQPEIGCKLRLPNSQNGIYEPDIVLKDKNGTRIRFIIEIEKDPMRKSIVGAAILADYSINQIQTNPAELIFIIYDPKGISQIHNFKQRITIVKPYCNNINNINVVSWDDFQKLDLK